MSVQTIIAWLALAGWVYLLLGRGFFWLARERDDRDEAPQAGGPWPSVTAVVPARNEADVVARSVGSLLAQDYPGAFRIILVDDASEDGTGDVGRSIPDPDARLEVLAGAPLPSGWTGKLWAVSQGVSRAGEGGQAPEFLLLTDADIAHASDNVRRLVERARGGGYDLVSLMARLTAATAVERLLIPGFVFFFAMLYPFAWVNDRSRRTAAAAGGCMLVRRAALESAGGIASIQSALIDDCALAALLKRGGPIWLGLTNRERSLRPYESLAAIGRMVSRSAYAQLGFSPLLLAGTVAGMALLYLAPPVIAVAGPGVARLPAIGAWIAMAVAFAPTLRFYGLGAWRGVLLPIIAGLYVVFTVASAVDVWRGRGGMWKGRAQAMAASA